LLLIVLTSLIAGLDIAALMRQGLVVFDDGAPSEPKRRQKRAADKEETGTNGSNLTKSTESKDSANDAMDTS